MTLEIVEIIEDEPAHAVLMDHALRKARYRTHVAQDGRSGIDDAKRLNPALILLDVMLPGMDGHEVCRRLRDDPQTRTIPIIMVSALGTLDVNRVAGLDLGVDDYVAKPFSPREIVARVKAVLRRSRSCYTESEDHLQGQFVLEESFCVVSFRGRRVQLTGREWWILRRLARKPGEIVTWEELTALLWGEDDLVHEHELDRLIRSLECKLGEQVSDWGAIAVIPEGGCALKLLPA